MTKVCALCTHHQWRGRFTPPVCTRQPPLVDRITGAESYTPCDVERSYSVFSRFLRHRNCGPEGIHFKAAVEPKLGPPPGFRWATPEEAEAFFQKTTVSEDADQVYTRDAITEGLPGSEPYSYEEFSRDCDRYDNN